MATVCAHTVVCAARVRWILYVRQMYPVFGSLSHTYAHSLLPPHAYALCALLVCTYYYAIRSTIKDNFCNYGISLNSGIWWMHHGKSSSYYSMPYVKILLHMSLYLHIDWVCTLAYVSSVNLFSDKIETWRCKYPGYFAVVDTCYYT